jgi:hypothetical protein
MTIQATVEQLAIKPRVIAKFKSKKWQFNLVLSAHFGFAMFQREIWNLWDTGHYQSGWELQRFEP